MAHVKTSDNVESACTATNEFDVRMAGDTVATGPQPVDYCTACNMVEPEWETVSAMEFSQRFPR